MANINDRNRGELVRLMAKHFRKTKEEIEKAVKANPEELKDFADWLEDGGRVQAR